MTNASIDEGEPTGTRVGGLTTTDQDAGNTHTYSLVAGDGDTDNASFSISESDLLSAAVFDYETKNSYSVRVQTEDGKGGTFAKKLTITVNDQDAKAQAITFAEIDDQIFEDETLTLRATASSGLDVSFELVSGPATLNGKVVTFTGPER